MNTSQKSGAGSSFAKIQHELRSAISLLAGAFESTSSDAHIDPEVNTLLKSGIKKIESVFGLIASSQPQVSKGVEQLDAVTLGYNGTREDIFSSEHPEVQKWTALFHDRQNQASIFQLMELKHPENSFAKASVVGVCWHEFSKFMPWFLCQAAANVSTNEKRHYVIQTAFEELGMRDANEIHPDMFWSTVKSVGPTESDRERILVTSKIGNVLSGLKSSFQLLRTESAVLGILLGLEIPAEENIETVFESLAHNEEARAILNESRFFALHRQIEPEHVRLTVSNFLRFCPNEDDREEFLVGFDAGLTFWRSFWNLLSGEIGREQTRGQSIA